MGTTLEKRCNATPLEMVCVRAALYRFWGEIGLKFNVLMTKEEFIEGLNKLLGHAEVRRKKTGNETYLSKVHSIFSHIVKFLYVVNFFFVQIHSTQIALKIG